MKDTWLSIIKRHFRFDSLLGDPGASPQTRSTFNQYRLPASKRLLLVLLKAGPWICGAGFLVAFAVSALPIAGLRQWTNDHGIFLEAAIAISVSGLIGYGTNFLAIRMLFRPVERRPIWGQGLIPSQRHRIIQSLAKGMHEHILSQELIQMRIEKTGLVRKLSEIATEGAVSLIQDQELRTEIKSAVHDSISDFTHQPAFRKEITDLIDQQLELSMADGVKRFVLQTYKRLNRVDYESTINEIITSIPKVTLDAMQRMESEVDSLAEKIRLQQEPLEAGLMQLLVNILDRIDIADILAKQMEHFDEGKLERMIWEATNEQLLYIQNLGTILGMLGGFLIWRPVGSSLVFIAVIGILWLLDVLLFKLRKPLSPTPPNS